MCNTQIVHDDDKVSRVCNLIHKIPLSFLHLFILIIICYMLYMLSLNCHIIFIYNYLYTIEGAYVV